MKLRLTDQSVILSLTTRSSCCVSCGWLIIIMIRPAVPAVANHNHINLWSIQCQWGLIWVSCCRVISREWEAGTHNLNPRITWQMCDNIDYEKNYMNHRIFECESQTDRELPIFNPVTTAIFTQIIKPYDNNETLKCSKNCQIIVSLP